MAQFQPVEVVYKCGYASVAVRQSVLNAKVNSSVASPSQSFRDQFEHIPRKNPAQRVITLKYKQVHNYTVNSLYSKPLKCSHTSKIRLAFKVPMYAFKYESTPEMQPRGHFCQPQGWPPEGVHCTPKQTGNG